MKRSYAVEGLNLKGQAVQHAELRRVVRSCRELITGEIALLNQWLDDSDLSPGRRAQLQIVLTQTNEGVGCPRWRADHVELLIDALPAGTRVKPLPPDVTGAISDCERSLERRQAIDPGVLPPRSFMLAVSSARDNASAAAELAETLYSDALELVE